MRTQVVALMGRSLAVKEFIFSSNQPQCYSRVLKLTFNCVFCVVNLVAFDDNQLLRHN